MNLLDIVFENKDFLRLKEEANKDKLAKAVLLISKDSDYLSSFADALSMLIFDGQACKECENCKKVISNSHPDLKKYPIKDKLLVADSEDIVNESFIKPIFANKKVFIINNIDNSMESAQNKLLKVLEEPTKNVYMICTCSNIDKVLPTIRSRCNKIELGKVDASAFYNLVSKESSSKAQLAFAVSDGMIGNALRFIKQKNFEDICLTALAVICDMKKSSQVLEYSKKILAFKDDVVMLIEVISILIEDLLKIKSGQKNIVKMQAYLNELDEVASEYSVRALIEIARKIDMAIKEKTYNVSINLILENLLLGILEVKYLCR